MAMVAGPRDTTHTSVIWPPAGSPVEQRFSSPVLITTVGADRGRGLLATGIVYV